MKPAEISDTNLARGSIGLREVLFQSITAMAPAGALAVSVAVGATYAGGALSLAVVFAFVPSLTVAVSIGQLAKHLPSAGSIYTYPAQALHPMVVSWWAGVMHLPQPLGGRQLLS